jgi:hypothetical protein
LVLPAWLAVMEHAPIAKMLTVLPDTVQTSGVVEAKLTVSPEVAVAEIANGAAPKLTLLSAGNVIVCVAGFTVILRGTEGAAAKLALPD